MILRPESGEWPTELAPLGAIVKTASINQTDRSLHLVLQHSANDTALEIPSPWMFTSCLASISSEQGGDSTSAKIADSDLIGLEGATLSAIEHDAKRIDLVFDSIRLSVSSDAS